MTTFAEECLERAEKATPGEWRHIPGDSYCAFPHVVCGPNKTLVFEDHSDHECADKHCDKGWTPDESDAEFIAHSRTDVVELAKRLQRACAALNIEAYHPYAGEENASLIALLNELESPIGEKE